MALIKCPECGDQISDKSSACIHCGYPLYLLNSEKPSETSVENQDITEVKVDLKEYSIKILNCNGSNAKVIITLKNKFQYSLDDAKTATMNLPLTVSLKENITEIRKLAQEFTEAGIDYEIFEGEKKLSFNLITKDKATKIPMFRIQISQIRYSKDVLRVEKSQTNVMCFTVPCAISV